MTPVPVTSELAALLAATPNCETCGGTRKRQGSCEHCRDRRVIHVGPAPTVNYGHAYSYPCPECSTPEGKAKPCPDCPSPVRFIPGPQLDDGTDIELTVECETCGGKGCIVEHWEGWGRCSLRSEPGCCAPCNASGRRTVGTAVVVRSWEVVGGQSPWSNLPEHSCIELDGRTATIWTYSGYPVCEWIDADISATAHGLEAGGWALEIDVKAVEA